MLGGWGFPAPCNSQTLLTTTPHSTTSFSLLLPQKPHQTHLSFFLNATSSFSLLKGRTGFSAFALKKRIKDKKNVLEMDGFDDGDDDIGDDEDEEDDEGVFIPLGNMNKWLENKPRGFGEGKEYDTSIEDKLLEEMEQSGQAQLVNIRKLKNNTVQPTSQKDHPPEQKATKIIPSGIRVRLLNLPKKKNIHRDLQSAFKGVPGIVNIAPAVSGNKKTRHPVCKGFAFVDLKSEQDANRFIQIVSKQSITFGKIQKLIKCEITNSRSPDSTSEQSTDDTYTSPQVTDPALEADSPTDFDIVDSSLDSWEETVSDESDGSDDDDLITADWENFRENLESFSVSNLNGGDSMEPRMGSATESSSSMKREKIQAIKKKPVVRKKREKVPQLNISGSAADWEDFRENLESFSVSNPNGGDSMEPRMGSATESSSSTKREKIQAIKKKPVVRKKREKVPQLNISGSAKRLKIKEKAVLTGVFTKYGVKAALSSREES